MQASHDGSPQRTPMTHTWSKYVNQVIWAPVAILFAINLSSVLLLGCHRIQKAPNPTGQLHCYLMPRSIHFYHTCIWRACYIVRSALDRLENSKSSMNIQVFTFTIKESHIWTLSGYHGWGSISSKSKVWSWLRVLCRALWTMAAGATTRFYMFQALTNTRRPPITRLVMDGGRELDLLRDMHTSS